MRSSLANEGPPRALGRSPIGLLCREQRVDVANHREAQFCRLIRLTLSDMPDFFAGRSLPFVFDSFTLVGAIDFETSEGDHLTIRQDSRQVRSAYPLYGGVQNYP
jgi:hypothetical protein